VKRITEIAIAVILLLGAGIAAVLVLGGSKKHTDNVAVSQPVKQKPNTACTIFTITDAKKILGNSAKGGEAGTNKTSADMQSSACSYEQVTSSKLQSADENTASLLVRTPQSEKGILSNNNQFGPLKPADAIAVDGYGSSAYWSPQLGQLNILKQNSWYIVSNGPIKPADRTLDEAKQLADILIDKM
jgi:hypothetical protein